VRRLNRTQCQTRTRRAEGESNRRASDRWFDGHERPVAPLPAEPSSADQQAEQGFLVPEQSVMLVVKNRRDGPWGLPF